MVTDWNTYVEFAETATANMCQDFIRIDPSILNPEPAELRGTGRYGCSATRPSRSLVLDSREPGRRCVTSARGKYVLRVTCADGGSDVRGHCRGTSLGPRSVALGRRPIRR